MVSIAIRSPAFPHHRLSGCAPDPPIDRDEHPHRHPRGALVAIGQRMVLRAAGAAADCSGWRSECRPEALDTGTTGGIAQSRVDLSEDGVRRKAMLASEIGFALRGVGVGQERE